MTENRVATGNFAIEREFKQSPTKVWAAFQDPAKKRVWMGGEAEGWQLDKFEPGFEEGGKETWLFRFGDSPQMSNYVTYHQILQEQRMVFTYVMDIGQGLYSISQASIELFPSGTGTLLVHTEQVIFLDGKDGTDDREHGTRELYNALEREIAKHG